MLIQRQHPHYHRCTGLQPHQDCLYAHRRFGPARQSPDHNRRCGSIFPQHTRQNHQRHVPPYEKGTSHQAPGLFIAYTGRLTSKTPIRSPRSLQTQPASAGGAQPPPPLDPHHPPNHVLPHCNQHLLPHGSNRDQINRCNHTLSRNRARQWRRHHRLVAILERHANAPHRRQHLDRQSAASDTQLHLPTPQWSVDQHVRRGRMVLVLHPPQRSTCIESQARHSAAKYLFPPTTLPHRHSAHGALGNPALACLTVYLPCRCGGV